MIAFKKIIKCTNAVRNAIRIDRSFLWKKKSVRLLTNRYTNYAGRNNTGRVVSRTHGTRVRKRVRIIDHGRCVYNVPCIVARVEYDPNRSSFISLAIFANGVCTYMLSSSNAAVGHIFTSYASDIVAFENYYTGLSTSFNIGDSSKLEYMPRGTVLFDVERSPYL
jgi:large subunit ribosomal protein L2